MQEEKPARRSNRDRSEETRAKLIAAARELFVANGFAETGTPEIVRLATVTRGALYHHFADKTELFRAVVMQEAEAVVRHIEQTSLEVGSPIDALMTGTRGYFEAMAKPGRAHLLLVEGPAVLGPDAMAGIDTATGGAALRAGLEHAAQEAAQAGMPMHELAVLLSASFDRAALEIARGADACGYTEAIRLLLFGLFRQRQNG